MKKPFSLLLILLSIQLFYCQKSFSLEIDAPNLKIDTVFVSYPAATRSTHLLHKYDFTADGSKKISEQGDIRLLIKGTANILTKFNYPQPVAISYYDTVKNTGMQSRIFFVEAANMKLLVKDDQLNFELLSSTPANIESEKLNTILKPYESKLKPYESNDAESVQSKELEIQKYIKKNPKSYVALWEIINDFSKYGLHPIYFDNLKLFDSNIKKSFTYIEFSKILKLEAEHIFPDINLDNKNHLSKETFKNYKLTLIDYWATFCKPCIQDMPKLVELYDQYKNQGVNFISIADEQTPERINKAIEILKKNNINWESYFDKNKEFPTKLNAAGYPLQILVDTEGNIVKRTYGELNVIKEFMTNYLSN
ncbi:MAG: hypothetical protein DI529_12505 [Chryseobacterium sp.]|nr:MAG: hypothetical protein DI529_12505 [Chryseobacterium sp.]